jgi:hypothetical protein
VATFDITTGVGYKGGLTVYSLAAAAVILGLLDGSWGGRHLFDFAPLRAVGRVSYGLYLWHYPVFYAVSVQGEQWTNFQRLVVALALTIGATIGSWYLIERPALSLKRRLGVDRPKTSATADVASPSPAVSPPVQPIWPWAVTDRRATGLALTAGVVAVAVMARFTVFVGDPATVQGAPESAGLAFPSGDVDRSGYWALVDLEPTFEDAFDRDDDPDGLGAGDTGQPWELVEGGWGILGQAATVSAPGAAHLATAPQEVNNGLVEVTLSVAAEGAGLAFRYKDPRNYWSVTATPTPAVWTVTQVVDGVATTAAEFPAPVFDGVTVTVTQNGSTIRFLVEGAEYFRLLDPEPSTVLRSGLVAVGQLASGARWDRYLVMASEADIGAGA